MSSNGFRVFIQMAYNFKRGGTSSIFDAGKLTNSISTRLVKLYSSDL